MAESRDYALTGAEGRAAVERGLASGQWYSSPIPRKRMKELMRRSDPDLKLSQYELSRDRTVQGDYIYEGSSQPTQPVRGGELV